MRKCPNCGQPTAQTADWACQWCGYPLLGGGYKKIDKTFRQLQEERLGEYERQREIETEVLEESISGPRFPRPVEPEPVRHPVPPASRIVPEAEPVPEPRVAPSPIVPEPPVEVVQPPPQPEPAFEQVPVSELLTEATPGTIETTVGRLASAFTRDREFTESKLNNRRLKVSGTVDKVIIKDSLDIFYIILTGEKGIESWNVRATFDSKQAPALRRLNEGQTVTVMGSYDGYGKNILMKDCILVG